MQSFREILTSDEICMALDVDDFSAVELLAGTIDFTVREILLLAKFKKMTLNDLLKFEFDDENMDE